MVGGEEMRKKVRKNLSKEGGKILEYENISKKVISN